MQVIVDFFESICLHFDTSEVSVNDVKAKLFETVYIPAEEIILTIDGIVMQNDETLSEYPLVVRALVRSAVSGGKGGFGAMLRAKAKQQGAKKTTDFGACRDLSGRRLRHINDEILLQKWKEAKENGTEFNPDEETPTGIGMWYLAKPSWAEGTKVNPQAKFYKSRRKTTICSDWMKAREGGRKAPEGAPVWWGCPRGAKCDFAHGDEELSGAAAENAAIAKKRVREESSHRELEEYVAPVIAASSEFDEEMDKAVLIGLKARSSSNGDTLSKKSKTVAQPKVEVEDDELPLEDYGF